jgi:hypothetical protein
MTALCHILRLWASFAVLLALLSVAALMLPFAVLDLALGRRR